MSPEAKAVYDKIYGIDKCRTDTVITMEELKPYLDYMNDQLAEQIQNSAKNKNYDLCRPIGDYLGFRKIYIEYLYDLEKDEFFRDKKSIYKDYNMEHELFKKEQESLESYINLVSDDLIKELSKKFLDKDILLSKESILRNKDTYEYIITHIMAFPKPVSIQDVIEKIDLSWHYDKEKEAAWSKRENPDQQYIWDNIVWLHIYYEDTISFLNGIR